MKRVATDVMQGCRKGTITYYSLQRRTLLMKLLALENPYACPHGQTNHDINEQI